MSHPKEKHYWTQLRAALTAGQWDINFPAKAPNAAPLSWSELLRKFNKHCPGCNDVSELASQTQALAILLSSDTQSTSLDVDGNRFDDNDPLSLGQECVLFEERMAEASQGYNILKGIGGSNTESIKLAVAYYAYALGQPSECLSLLSQVKDITDTNAHIPASISARSQLSGLQIPGSGADSSSSSWTGSFTSSPSLGSVPDIENGRSWAMTECTRSICLQGMSHERISPDEPQTALNAYLSASSLLKAIASDIPCSLPLQAGGVAGDPGSFARYRELWRWTERLLRRAIILSAKLSDLSQSQDDGHSIWALFGYYRTCSAHWPATFRPHHRSTVLVLHLRALILRARALSPAALKTKAPRWISMARSAIQEYRTILNVSTVFPRAGERNVKVEDFVDLCVAVWEADGAVGEYAGWVIDVLWWATRLTFNSFRIYRHMTRLLFAAGDPDLAKRTLRLYIQVVSKAREATMADSPETLAEEVDTDRHWVDTLVFGARMLCRLALQGSDYRDALELAKEAGTMVQKAKLRLDEEDVEVVGSVKLAEGIWSAAMAHTEQDPLTREARLSESLNLLTSAVGTYPTPSSQHHLALALCKPGPSQNLQLAIEHARASVEGDPSEVRHWHLLGLILAITEDWTAAKSVLEFGVGAGEAELTGDDDTPQSPPGQSSINIRDFASTEHLHENGLPNGHSTAPNSAGSSHPIGTILDPHDSSIPSSDTLLQPTGDRPHPSRHERFEYALQVRMTQLALTEMVAGAEGVSDKWLDVFHWFREKRGVNVDDRRMSIDSRRVSSDTRPLSDIASVQEPPPIINEPPTSVEALSDAEHHPHEDLPTPIPITITPASPGILPPQFNGASTDGQLGQPPPLERRSNSLDEKSGDISRGKKVKQVLKTRVHKGQATFSTISKKIGHGVGGVGRRSSLNLKRNVSTPDFHSVLGHQPSQASSIHLRQYQSIHASQQDLRLLEVPPPPSPSPTPPANHDQNARGAKDRRLLSDLWLMSAAIFRRLDKIEQARGAIQEAEVRDEDNPAVWVQLGLYYTALGERRHAIQAFQKALFVSPNDVSATIHLCRLYLTPHSDSSTSKDLHLHRDNIDLAVGLLSDLTKGRGWDVSEAWYFLARGYKLQGRRDRERECLGFALTLSETRGVRDIGSSVGWCL
ncbi:hypothetical protein EIP91_003737 [Steccherinum ochraceum]|uniref:Uncharacterized protein n=1 Tax=Steccherinum ochraceum TaxID=92696 RepID=A0A4R0S256_9APHY|nr:hypothetical protein EIP91_003737 [Steccherinum ochraceum]